MSQVDRVINSMTNLSLDCIYVSFGTRTIYPVILEINRFQFIRVILFMLLNRLYQRISSSRFMTPICLIEWFTIYVIFPSALFAFTLFFYYEVVSISLSIISNNMCMYYVACLYLVRKDLYDEM